MPTAPILTATRTGLVDLLNPDPKTITLEAIAHGLSQINRWAGATEFPVSVAQHSILVMEIFLRLCPNLRPYAIYPLLHDAHEAFIGDVSAPLKSLLPDYKLIEKRIEAFVRGEAVNRVA
jgi:5'-deoxynucleotidase YfbR-like HD superfamily hydrolase